MDTTITFNTFERVSSFLALIRICASLKVSGLAGGEERLESSIWAEADFASDLYVE
jgi:hypothetical protein